MHVTGKRNLTAGTNEVVLLGFDLEIAVTYQIIIQEAGGQLTGYGKAGKCQGIRFTSGQGGGGSA